MLSFSESRAVFNDKQQESHIWDSQRQDGRSHFRKELVEAGRIKSVIDCCYPSEQTAETNRYVETGHKIRTRRHKCGP
jgi:hypothetical protein